MIVVLALSTVAVMAVAALVIPRVLDAQYAAQQRRMAARHRK